MSFCISAALFFFFFLPCYFSVFFLALQSLPCLDSVLPLTCLFPFAAVCLPSPGAELELSLPRACQHMRSNRACLLPLCCSTYDWPTFARICLAWAPHRRHWPCAGPPHFRPSSVAPQTWLLRCIFLALPSDHKGRLAIWRFECAAA